MQPNSIATARLGEGRLCQLTFTDQEADYQQNAINRMQLVLAGPEERNQQALSRPIQRRAFIQQCLRAEGVRTGK
jgi:hypothetical protein